MCSRANMSCMLTCSCANVSCMLTCSRAYVPCVLQCSRVSVPCVLTCSRANVSCVLTCSRANVLCVLTRQRILYALRTYVLTCYNYKWPNDKDKFSITCFPYILWLFFAFFLWNKTVVNSCISLTSQKSLTCAMTNFVQWNGLIFVWA